MRYLFPFIGSKSRIANAVWAALGSPSVFVEPFAGRCDVLFARPHEPGIETINDIDGLIANVWRAIQKAPELVAMHCDYPIVEVDLFAWHNELVKVSRSGQLVARLEADTRWCDPELAGRWIWGASQWIGGEWCGPFPKRQLPDICALGGKGVHGQTVANITEWVQAISSRLRRVRVTCGDFERVLSDSALYVEGSNVAGVFLDPPYSQEMRDPELYGREDATASQRARAWAIANGDNPARRIVLAGLEGEHEMPSTWRCVAWTGAPGLGRVSGNRFKERLWLSPHCVRNDVEGLPLFLKVAQ